MAQFKKITNRVMSGDRGIAFIHGVCSRIGFAFHPTNQALDAGIDGFIEIRDTETERATNCVLQVQSKAESGRFTAETDSSFEFLCDERDINYWLAGNTPIILVVSRPTTSEGYWVDVKQWFSDDARRRERRIFFDKKAQRFDESCKSSLVTLAVPKDSGLYFAPVPKTETLLSNLLPVTLVAPDVFGAETHIREPQEVWQWAREMELRLPSEWFLSAGRIFSVHDLREEPWVSICDRGTVERNDVSEWSLSNDPEMYRQFVRLLNQCLREKLQPHGVRFQKSVRRYYFLPPFSLHTRSYSYRSLMKRTSRDVFRPYKSQSDPSRVSYYRHSAFEGQFQRFADEWFLEITPTYLYTFDGKTLSKFDGDLLKGVKRLEKNLAVLGQVVMWAEVLTKPPELFVPDYPYLRFGDLSVFSLGMGVNDCEWRNREPENEKEVLEPELEFEGLFK